MASNIKIERVRKELSQVEMAKRLGISRPFYAKIEENPGVASGNLLNQLAQFFDCTIDYLVNGGEE